MMPAGRRTFFVVISLLIALFLVYKNEWGYERFDLVDVTQPFVFMHTATSSGNHTMIRMRVKAEIDSKATIEAYLCNNPAIPRHKEFNPLLFLRIYGTCDTILSHDYYTERVCIRYQPEKVRIGNVSVSISIR